MSEYAIHGGDEGKKRLDILSRTVGPGTELFLKKAGNRSGLHCLDLGCDAGTVTLRLAELAGPSGQATGLDIDERKIHLARQAAQDIDHVRFELRSAYDLNEEAAYDLVYSRFLLSHLQSPEVVLQKMWQALKPGGLLLVEDTDFAGHFCYPASGHFQRYVSLYEQLLKKRGANADLGRQLPGLLRETGFQDVEFQISQPAHLEGEGKLMAEITFAGIAGALVAEGLVTEPQAERLHAGLVRFRKRNGTLMSLPRIVQVSGRRV